MKQERRAAVLIVTAILLLTPVTGYGQDAAFSIPVPAAGGNAVTNHLAEIGTSNTKDGYVMVRYLKQTDKQLRVIIKGPGATPYIYRLRADGKHEVYPLSEGNGYYQITVYENVFDNKYSEVLTTVQNVRLEDEFAPFIRPNQYVNYSSDSEITKKAAELTQNSKTVTGKITAIYNYVIKNITYDQQLAATIRTGYIPDVDKVLQKKSGVCFDYAVVTAAMLRSQGIPAKLVIGYSGNLYHAWISAYSAESGWVDGNIYFDGKSWKLMDPTLAARSNNRSPVLKYTGNGSNYTAKYFY